MFDSFILSIKLIFYPMTAIKIQFFFIRIFIQFYRKNLSENLRVSQFKIVWDRSAKFSVGTCHLKSLEFICLWLATVKYSEGISKKLNQSTKKCLHHPTINQPLHDWLMIDSLSCFPGEIKICTTDCLIDPFLISLGESILTNIHSISALENLNFEWISRWKVNFNKTFERIASWYA